MKQRASGWFCPKRIKRSRRVCGFGGRYPPAGQAALTSPTEDGDRHPDLVKCVQWPAESWPHPRKGPPPPRVPFSRGLTYYSPLPARFHMVWLSPAFVYLFNSVHVRARLTADPDCYGRVRRESEKHNGLRRRIQRERENCECLCPCVLPSCGGSMGKSI